MFEPKWELRISNERYDIWDCKIGDFTVSITHLNPGQGTRGHNHLYPELYIPLKGEAEMLINKAYVSLNPLGSNQGRLRFYEIRPDIFHQVISNTEESTDFLCVFRKED